MYVAHLQIDDFVSAVEMEGYRQVFVQRYTVTSGQPVEMTTSSIVLTAGTASAPVLLARIVVERMQHWNHEAQRRREIGERSALALETVLQYLRARMSVVLIRPGILLQPGMLSELPKIETDHDLWTWNVDKEDRSIRTLVPREQSSIAD